jgi:hypothetical protein
MEGGRIIRGREELEGEVSGCVSDRKSRDSLMQGGSWEKMRGGGARRMLCDERKWEREGERIEGWTEMQEESMYMVGRE